MWHKFLCNFYICFICGIGSHKRVVRNLFTPKPETHFQLFRFNEFFAIFLFKCRTCTPLILPLLSGSIQLFFFPHLFCGFLCVFGSRPGWSWLYGISMFKPLETEIHSRPRKALFIRFSAVLGFVRVFFFLCRRANRCTTSFLIKFAKRTKRNPF